MTSHYLKIITTGNYYYFSPINQPPCWQIKVPHLVIYFRQHAVLSVSVFTAAWQSNTEERLYNPRQSHRIQLLPVQPRHKTNFVRRTESTLEYNPDDRSDPNLPYSRFYAHGVNALSSERRLASEASCWDVSAPWRVLLRHWRGHLFRFLPLTAGAFPI